MTWIALVSVKKHVFFSLYNIAPHTTPRCRFFSNSRSREIRADFKIVKNWKIKTEISKGGFWLNNFYMPLLLHLIFHQKREKMRFFPSSVSRMSLVICKVSWRQKTVSDVDVDNKLRNSKWNCKDQKDLEATLSRKSKQFLIKLVSRKKIHFCPENRGSSHFCALVLGAFKQIPESVFAFKIKGRQIFVRSS